MKRFAARFVLLAVFAVAGAQPVLSDPEGRPDTVVVVELFTSQGCSSCPPADRLLARLAGAPQVEGVVVIPLAFHVDYWNYIGWQDPFSSEEWSNRQRRYAVALGLDTIYTPQLVLDGRRQLVGADERELLRELRDLARELPAVELRLAVDATAPSPGTLRLNASGEVISGEPPRRLLVLVALFQDGLVTPVARGENARKTLANERVVRQLVPLFELGPKAGASGQTALDLALEPDWPRDDLGLVLFAQDAESMEILGATSLDLGSVSQLPQRHR